jgi:hypothetical protein
MWLLVLTVCVVVLALAVLRAGRLWVFDHPIDPDAQGRFKRPPGLNVVITGALTPPPHSPCCYLSALSCAWSPAAL